MNQLPKLIDSVFALNQDRLNGKYTVHQRHISALRNDILSKHFIPELVSIINDYIENPTLSEVYWKAITSLDTNIKFLVISRATACIIKSLNLDTLVRVCERCVDQISESVSEWFIYTVHVGPDGILLLSIYEATLSVGLVHEWRLRFTGNREEFQKLSPLLRNPVLCEDNNWFGPDGPIGSKHHKALESVLYKNAQDDYAKQFDHDDMSNVSTSDGENDKENIKPNKHTLLTSSELEAWANKSVANVNKFYGDIARTIKESPKIDKRAMVVIAKLSKKTFTRRVYTWTNKGCSVNEPDEKKMLVLCIDPRSKKHLCFTFCSLKRQGVYSYDDYEPEKSGSFLELSKDWPDWETFLSGKKTQTVGLPFN